MRVAVLLVFQFITFVQFGQNINPGIDDVFRPNELAIINIIMDPAHKAFLLDPANSQSEEYFPAIFKMMNSKMDTLLEKEVGVRLRGNTSRGHDKKGFKIDFREYGGGRFFGYKKFNLKPDVNDPSLLRELLTLQIYREMGVPAARVHPVKLYMNDEYMGAYINVEQIDDEFLNMRHGHEEGFLYKCSYGADLQNDGQVFNTTTFESEINEDTDTRAELNSFVQTLNTVSTANFKIEIEKVFDFDTYLKQLAVEALLGHWDGYSYNKNNYYLFYNGQTQKFEFFPYDADNTWGIDWVGRDWALRDLNEWSNRGEGRPLTTRILAVDAYWDLYIQYLKVLLENYFNEDYLFPILDSYKILMADAVATDTYFDNAFGFTYTNFNNSFSTGMNNHVKYGLKEYLEVRTESAIDQIPMLITDVSDLRNQASLSLFPNPSDKAFFYIDASQTVYNKPVVYSTTGRLIKTDIQLTEVGLQISFFENITPGLYVIRYGNITTKWIYR